MTSQSLILYICSKYLEQSNWRFPSLIWLQLEIWALSRKTEVVELLLLWFPAKSFVQRAKMQSMKSFAFTSLAALGLAKRSSWAKIRDDQSPRQVLIYHFLTFIQRYYSNWIYYSFWKCASATKSITDFLCKHLISHLLHVSKQARFENFKLKGVSGEWDLVVDLKRSRI